MRLAQLRRGGQSCANLAHRVQRTGGEQVHAEFRIRSAGQFGKLDVQQDLVFRRRRSNLQVADSPFCGGRDQRQGALGDGRIAGPPDQRHRVAGGAHVDFLIGKRFAQQPAHGFQVRLYASRCRFSASPVSTRSRPSRVPAPFR